METHIWLWKYTFLFMSGYGHDESAPTPNGMFATNFVGVCGYFTDYSPRIHGTNMVYWGGMQSQNL